MATIKYENLDIENVDVKEEVDSLENRHHDDVGETRLENIQGQDPLEPALSLDFFLGHPFRAKDVVLRPNHV